MSKTRDIYLNHDSFANMPRLRFLKFYNSCDTENNNKVHSSQALESDFAELRYLSWYKCPLELPMSSFHLKNLVILDMRHSKVKQLWDGIQNLVKLKEMDLSFSNLEICPDLSGSPNLKRLNLRGCKCLREISSSMQNLNKLEFLDLRYCRTLDGIPDCSGLESLINLSLCGCRNIKMLPEMPCNIKELFLTYLEIEQLPSSMQYLSSLVSLNLSYCPNLKSLPNSISWWVSLKTLQVSGCKILDELPDDIGSLKSLRFLDAMETAIRTLPPSITRLENIESIYFGNHVQDNVGWLLATLDPKVHWDKLRCLDLSDSGITKIPDHMYLIHNVSELILSKNNFKSIPASIKKLNRLECLDVSNCKELTRLPKLELRSLVAYNCTSLKVLSGFSFRDRRCFDALEADFVNCSKLVGNIFEGILKDAIIKKQCEAGQVYQYNGGDKFCYPGSEIPKWFNVQPVGSSINVRLPPAACVYHDFLGFFLCVVVAPCKDEISDSFLLWECTLKSKEGYTHVKKRAKFDSYGLFKNKGWSKDHVCVVFDVMPSPRYDSEVSFQFYIVDDEDIEVKPQIVKKCGVCLLYQGLEEIYGSFSVHEKEDSLSSENVEEEDAPHPKRLKLVEIL